VGPRGSSIAAEPERSPDRKRVEAGVSSERATTPAGTSCVSLGPAEDHGQPRLLTERAWLGAHVARNTYRHHGMFSCRSRESTDAMVLPLCESDGLVGHQWSEDGRLGAVHNRRREGRGGDRSPYRSASLAGACRQWCPCASRRAGSASSLAPALSDSGCDHRRTWSSSPHVSYAGSSRRAREPGRVREFGRPDQESTARDHNS
jgi:hypothetical protein